MGPRRLLLMLLFGGLIARACLSKLPSATQIFWAVAVSHISMHEGEGEGAAERPPGVAVELAPAGAHAD